MHCPIHGFRPCPSTCRIAAGFRAVTAEQDRDQQETETIQAELLLTGSLF